MYHKFSIFLKISAVTKCMNFRMFHILNRIDTGTSHLAIPRACLPYLSKEVFLHPISPDVVLG